jgi:hypothetical protein
MKLIFALVTAFAFIAGAQAQEADTKKLVPGKLPSPSEVGKAVATDAKAAASATKDNAKGLVNNATQKPAAAQPTSQPAADKPAAAQPADKAAMKPAAEAPKAAAPAAKMSKKKGKKKARKAAK